MGRIGAYDDGPSIEDRHAAQRHEVHVVASSASDRPREHDDRRSGHGVEVAVSADACMKGLDRCGLLDV